MSLPPHSINLNLEQGYNRVHDTMGSNQFWEKNRRVLCLLYAFWGHFRESSFTEKDFESFGSEGQIVQTQYEQEALPNLPELLRLQNLRLTFGQSPLFIELYSTRKRPTKEKPRIKTTSLQKWALCGAGLCSSVCISSTYYSGNFSGNHCSVTEKFAALVT